MPIHDQSYRHYEGRRAPKGVAWQVIARTGIVTIIKKRAFVGLLLFAWIPFAVRAVQIYLATYYPQATFLAATAGTFREFLQQQQMFFTFIMPSMPARASSRTIKANALQIYFSKPISRRDYMIGKLGVLVFFLALPYAACRAFCCSCWRSSFADCLPSSGRTTGCRRPSRATRS